MLKPMNKLYLYILFFGVAGQQIFSQEQFIARQGQISFFSYTSVENIEAKNNQVLSILDVDNNEMAVSMLMRAFTFKKDLMYEHFNESYIESDLFPKATFQGKFPELDVVSTDSQFIIVKGVINIHGISKNIDIKTEITKSEDGYLISGEFDLVVDDFNIKIPLILSRNIAKIVSVKINFQYSPYEEVND